MGGLRNYIITIICAAIIAAMVEKLSVSTSTQKAIKLVSGLFISVTLLSPLGNFKLNTFRDYFDAINLDAKDVAAYGEGYYKENLTDIISDRCESYILDKANQLGANISVEIQCSTADVPIPVGAEISGTISPYIKKTLKNIIETDIGIPEEKQLWI